MQHLVCASIWYVRPVRPFIVGSLARERGAVITAAKSGDGNAYCDFWDGVPLLWPHI